MIVPAQLEQHQLAMARRARMAGDIAPKPRKPPVLETRKAGRCTVTIRGWDTRFIEEREAVEEAQREAQRQLVLATLASHADIALPRTYPSIVSLIARVSVQTGVTALDICSARRTRHIVLPRQFAMWLAKMSTPLSLPSIGRGFGGRDHTTVLHAVRKIDVMIADGTLPENLKALIPTGKGV